MSKFSGEVDLQQLEKELERSCKEADRYQLQNEAKFRAVHQQVESFEQFEGIVKACHLKPLDKGDLVGTDSRSHRWNQFSEGVENNSDGYCHKLTIGEKSTIVAIPNSLSNFIKSWELLQSNAEKLNFLSDTGTEHFEKLFKKEITSTIFENILHILVDQCLLDDANEIDIEFVLCWFEALTRCGRFNIAAVMLPKKTAVLIKSAFNRLEELDCQNSIKLQTLKSIFI